MGWTALHLFSSPRLLIKMFARFTVLMESFRCTLSTCYRLVFILFFSFSGPSPVRISLGRKGRYLSSVSVYAFLSVAVCLAKIAYFPLMRFIRGRTRNTEQKANTKVQNKPPKGTLLPHYNWLPLLRFQTKLMITFHGRLVGLLTPKGLISWLMG